MKPSALKRSKCSTLVLKVASRCNLACTYCYMYFLGDTSYKQQPKVMSQSVVQAIIDNVRELCITNDLDTFNFVFHGGEPMLAGKAFFAMFVRIAKETLEPDIYPLFLMQTNGTLIDEDWCKLFNECKIGIGISLDGTQLINDRFRIDHKGRGSYDSVINGLNIYRNLSIIGGPGLISVVNLDANPVEAYKHFKSLGAATIELMLPDATYEKMPGKLSAEMFEQWDTPYADWLIKVFDYWFYDKDSAVNIRLFETIILMILGGDTSMDTIGSSSNEVLVIETDGSIEPASQLKICGQAFTKLNLNILTNTLEEAQNNDLVDLYIHSGSRLCTVCRQCPIKEVCGGGYLSHRYSEHNGFDNPSVYCHDLVKLISHIQNKIFADLLPDGIGDLEIELLSYNAIKLHLQELCKQTKFATLRLQQYSSSALTTSKK